jgi:predicted flap endonuclease-1-like 5' DNA nuclease
LATPPAAPNPTSAAPTVSSPAPAPTTIAPAAKAAAPASTAPSDPQLGFAFDSRNIRAGSRNLLTHEVFGKGDDLKEIVGVAAGLERLLHDIGVYYFWQIAEWTAQDVTYVDQRLKAFKGRILRDDWIRQCAKLAKKAGAAQKPT